MKCFSSKKLTPPSAFSTGAEDCRRTQAAGDLRTGISASDGSLGAALNVLQSGLSPKEIVDLALQLARVNDVGMQNLLVNKLGAQVATAWAENFKADYYCPRGLPKEPVDHQKFILGLLLPSNNLALVEDASEVLFAKTIEGHASALDNLRQYLPKVYKQIFTGKFAAAFKAMRNKSGADFSLDELAEVIRRQARLYAIKTAHNLIQLIRRHSRDPFGSRFSGHKRWHLMGHTCMAAIAVPALILQKLALIGAREEAAGMSDQQTYDFLVDRRCLPPGNEGIAIFDIAKVTRDIAQGRKCKKGEFDFPAALKRIAEVTSSAACLTRGDMKRNNLANLSFVEFRLGLTATEASSYIAKELLQTFSTIDGCIDALRKGRALPLRTMLMPSLKNMAFAASILRAEGQPDKNATPVGQQSTFECRHLDKDRGSGRGPVKQMLKKLSDGVVPPEAAKILSIDATLWFRR